MTLIYYEHFSQCKSIVHKPHKTYIIPNISIFGKYVSIPRWSQCLFSQVPSMSSRLSLALPSVSPLALVPAQFFQFWYCFGSRNDCKVYSTCRSSSQSFSSCVFLCYWVTYWEGMEIATDQKILKRIWRMRPSWETEGLLRLPSFVFCRYCFEFQSPGPTAWGCGLPSSWYAAAAISLRKGVGGGVSEDERVRGAQSGLRSSRVSEDKCCLFGCGDDASWVNRIREDPFLCFDDNEGKNLLVTDWEASFRGGEWEPLHFCGQMVMPSLGLGWGLFSSLGSEW